MSTFLLVHNLSHLACSFYSWYLTSRGVDVGSRQGESIHSSHTPKVWCLIPKLTNWKGIDPGIFSQGNTRGLVSCARSRRAGAGTRLVKEEVNNATREEPCRRKHTQLLFYTWLLPSYDPVVMVTVLHPFLLGHVSVIGFNWLVGVVSGGRSLLWSSSCRHVSSGCFMCSC